MGAGGEKSPVPWFSAVLVKRSKRRMPIKKKVSNVSALVYSHIKSLQRVLFEKMSAGRPHAAFPEGTAGVWEEDIV